jgi:hypothetical protein
MGKLRLLFLASVILSLPQIGLCDIIVTTDDMVLNGKIIEDIKNVQVKLGNFHGIFIVNYNQIKEIHRTEMYQDDIKIFKKLGKTVDEEEIKTNYQAGIKKLEERTISEKKSKAVPMECVLFVSPFLTFNIGKIQPVLPFSYGIFLLGDVRFQSRFRFLPNGVRTGLQYFHSEKTLKKIAAFRFDLGTVWNFPFNVRGFTLNLTLSPLFGGGYYAVKGRYSDTAGFKWNVTVTAGLEFIVSSWVISPQVRFDYIYDRIMPLYGIGFSLGAGYLFKI